jgi:hypothetical protein
MDSAKGWVNFLETEIMQIKCLRIERMHATIESNKQWKLETMFTFLKLVRLGKAGNSEFETI